MQRTRLSIGRRQRRRLVAPRHCPGHWPNRELQRHRRESTGFHHEIDDVCSRVARNTPCGATSSFPAFPGSHQQSGAYGVAAYVSQGYGTGAIGYADENTALRFGLQAAKVRNSSGEFVSPTAQNVSVALLGVRVVSNPGRPDDQTQNLTGVYNSRDPRAYPISSYAYLIAPTGTDGTFTTAKGASLATFIRYLLCDGQQSVDADGYAALPRNLVTAGLAQMSRIPGASGVSTDLATCANPALQLTETDGAATGQVTIQATTIAAADGTLSLESTPGEAPMFDDPHLENGVSVTRGTLASTTVDDQRVVSRPSWDLTANLTDFTKSDNASVTIPRAHIGLKARILSTTVPGPQIAAEQPAGRASYPAAFAFANPATGVGSTLLGGDLTLVAPVDNPAGTYTAKLTVTVTSR